MSNTFNKSLKIQQWLVSALVAVLFSLVLWFAVLSQPPALPYTATEHGNHMVYHGVTFNVTEANGKPAPFAIVTVADQQIIADQAGVARFGHLLHTNYESVVFYQNQHYKQNLSVYDATIPLKLDSLSQEFRRLISTACAIALAVLLIFLLISNRRKTTIKSTTSSYKLKGLKWQTLGFAALLLSFTAAILLTSLNNPLGVQAANDIILDSLPVPQKIQLEQDDNNAIIEWNGGLVSPGEAELPNVAGYKVSWGTAGQPLSNITLTDYRIAQLQPLVNGQAYELQIQAVDKRGNLSKPSQKITFTGDPARVNAMRSRMNGFFDDFNLPAGGFDELKWNEAYSACNDPALSAFFINNQYHSHNLINDANCDRGQSVSRPRQTFDFTNRTGMITFDFDGSFRRDVWYLDFVPELIDIGGHVSLDNPQFPAAPVNMLRIRQSEQSVGVIWVDANGVPNQLAETDGQPLQPLDWQNLNLVSNIRRHWVVQVSQNKIEILVNGKSVLNTKLNLPFSRANLLWTQFSYNTAKSNQPYNLIHWDNFGFDAPAGFKPTTITHNYRAAKPGGGDILDSSADEPGKTNITIPDLVAGSKAERLMFTIQSNGYEWSSEHKVSINGTAFAVPQLQSGNLSNDDLVGVLTPYTSVINLPPGTLKQGENEISFDLRDARVLNIHTELDFDLNTALAFTPSYQIHQNERKAMPAMLDVGPNAAVLKIGKYEEDFRDQDQVFEVSGTVDVNVQAFNEVALHATGKNPGITKIQLMLGNEVVYNEEFNPAPSYIGTLKFDSTKYANGVYPLFLRAYNVYGTTSLPDYFETASKGGDYFPINIKINNAKSGTVVVAAYPPTPTPKPDTAPTVSGSSAGNPGPPDTSSGTSKPPIANIPVPSNSPANSANQTQANSSNRWLLLYAAGGLLLVIYLSKGILVWGAVRKSLRAANPTLPALPHVSIEHMLFWPFLQKKARKPKPPQTN